MKIVSQSYTKKAMLAAGALCLASTAANAGILNVADALDQTGNYAITTSVGTTVSGDDSVYLVATIEYETAVFGGFMFNGVQTYLGSDENASFGQRARTTGWSIYGGAASGVSSTIIEDTPTLLVMKINQTTGQADLFISPDLNQPEPLVADFSVTDATEYVKDINNVVIRGGQYSGATNSNVVNYTGVALYYGDDTPFVPEPSSLALLGLGGLLAARRRRSS